MTLLGTVKGRSKLVFGLNHCGDIDMRFAVPVPVGGQYADSIFNILRRKGASDSCYVMSTNPDTDEQNLQLRKALLETIGMGCGTFISCIPGKLGYFEFEDPGERYILER